MAYQQITSGLGAGDVFTASTATQLNDNIEDTRTLLAAANRYAVINARVIYDNAGAFASYTTVASEDGFDLTIAVSVSPSFTVTMSDNWNAAQSPTINLSRVVTTSGGPNNAGSELQTNSLGASNTIGVSVSGLLNTDGYIDLEIKYDRLGVLPV